MDVPFHYVTDDLIGAITTVPHWRRCVVSLSKTLKYPLLSTGSIKEDPPN